MTPQIVLRSSPVDRRQPLLVVQDSSSQGGRRFTEVAGGATAECAAICCCCPCGIVNLLLLAVYKVPAGLCRRALRSKRRRRLRKKGLLPHQQSRCKCGCDDTELQMHAVLSSDPVMVKSIEMDQDMMELEKEMWDRFYGTGFWRSPSQRARDQ